VAESHARLILLLWWLGAGRSLDALHVATAVRAGVDVLVTYDRCMTQAAEAVGLITAAP
jgi:predicted nucleic acid-binding protein